jgi:hypothetical protein
MTLTPRLDLNQCETKQRKEGVELSAHNKRPVHYSFFDISERLRHPAHQETAAININL